jgi:two-component system, cell cycle sensor histidine kinase and response regulator CckA
VVSNQQDSSIKTFLTGNETILLVEDAKGILKMASMLLERLGYKVLPASTPGEAIRIVEDSGFSEIHLLMTDVVMPEMNGHDLAQKLLSMYPNLKCLFMSGYTANVIAHQGMLDDGVAFIQKPFSMADMTAKVRELLDMASGKS